MSETMQRDLFEKELPKMINIFLGMYSREKNHLPITQGLCNCLTAAVLDGSRVLDPVLQVLMSNLHKMVIVAPELAASNPTAMKNFNELLRCFEIIGIRSRALSLYRPPPTHSFFPLHQLAHLLTMLSSSCSSHSSQGRRRSGSAP